MYILLYVSSILVVAIKKLFQKKRKNWRCLHTFKLPLLLWKANLHAHKSVGLRPLSWFLRQGWYSGFQVTGMIEWGKNQNPKKSLHQNLTPKKSHDEFPSHKNFQRNYAARIHQIAITKLQIVLNTPKNHYLRVSPWVHQAGVLHATSPILMKLGHFKLKGLPRNSKWQTGS